MENYLAKTLKPKIFSTLPNFRINGGPHDSKPHKQRTKCSIVYENSTYSFHFSFHGKILKHFARSFHEAQTLKLGGVVM